MADLEKRVSRQLQGDDWPMPITTRLSHRVLPVLRLKPVWRRFAGRAEMAARRRPRPGFTGAGASAAGSRRRCACDVRR